MYDTTEAKVWMPVIEISVIVYWLLVLILFQALSLLKFQDRVVQSRQPAFVFVLLKNCY